MGKNQMMAEAGPTLSAQDVADIFGIDPRTVRKYAIMYGGVEVAPGRYRFFEKYIRKMYADSLIKAR